MGWSVCSSALASPLPGGTLNPATIPKFQDPLVILPAQRPVVKNRLFTIYSIVARQFEQQILPSRYPATTVWGYGSSAGLISGKEDPSFHSPGLTIETGRNERVYVDWVNGLLDENNDYLPHLLPVDPALHWANPPGPPDSRPVFDEAPPLYKGPVPLVTHVHGARVSAVSNGYPEAWSLPHADDIPPEYFKRGTHYGSVTPVSMGHAMYEYDNGQRAAALWYHDNALGIAPLNMYAGLAGFWLIRDDEEANLHLPGPAPSVDDPPGTKYYEIPLMVQDRSFNDDGSLFFPDKGASHEGPAYGNTMVVNGRAWPYLEVEARRYRFRLLNGCNGRFLILKFGTHDLKFWQIGSDGGLLAEPVELEEILIAPGERADVIVDFSGARPNSRVTLLNVGPDGPFSSGPGTSGFRPADPGTTGKVMQFRIVPSSDEDTSTAPGRLELPPLEELGPEDYTRQVSLTEIESETVLVSDDKLGNVSRDDKGLPFDRIAGRLGEIDGGGTGAPKDRADEAAPFPTLDTTEVWEIYNLTQEAHPVHLHLVEIELVNRQPFDGKALEPGKNEKGFKDTVIAYPGEITRIKAHFDRPDLYASRSGVLGPGDEVMLRSFEVVGDELAWPGDSSSPLRSLLRSLKWSR